MHKDPFSPLTYKGTERLRSLQEPASYGGARKALGSFLMPLLAAALLEGLFEQPVATRKVPGSFPYKLTYPTELNRCYASSSFTSARRLRSCFATSMDIRRCRSFLPAFVIS
jgi:hypothetical protein